MAHSPIAPSSAHRWVKCAASVKACRDLPDEESDAAREGTAAHELAEFFLQRLKSDSPDPIREDHVGELTSNGVAITDEMFDACEIYRDEIKSIIEKVQPAENEYGIETRFENSKIHDQLFGTVDFWLYDSYLDVLYLIDFKYGFKPVSPVENWQLITYSSFFPDLKIREIVFKIVQPRAFGFEPVRSWATDFYNLPIFYQQLSDAAHSAFISDPKATTGEHCDRCLNLLRCEAARLSTLSALDFIGTRSNVIVSDNQQLNAELIELERAKNIVEMMLAAKQTDALERLKSGESLPDWQVGNARGKTSWSVDDSQVLAMAELCGVNVAKPVVAMTPKQAIKAGLNPDVVNSMSEKKSGAVKLTRVDIKRTKEILSK